MYVRDFFAGMLLFNALPHLCMGISGKTHMTPFRRVSSPVLNIVWAFANILLGLVILGIDPVTGGLNALKGLGVWSFVLGGFLMSIANAWLFGKPEARLPWHKD